MFAWLFCILVGMSRLLLNFKKSKVVKTDSEHQSWSCGVVVITSALHAEGPQFDPGRDQLLFTSWKVSKAETYLWVLDVNILMLGLLSRLFSEISKQYKLFLSFKNLNQQLLMEVKKQHLFYFLIYKLITNLHTLRYALFKFKPSLIWSSTSVSYICQSAF